MFLLHSSTIQIEQQIGLILGRRDVVKGAVQEWTNKWVPAIIQLNESLTGKQGAMYKQSQMTSHYKAILECMVITCIIQSALISHGYGQTTLCLCRT